MPVEIDSEFHENTLYSKSIQFSSNDDNHKGNIA